MAKTIDAFPALGKTVAAHRRAAGKTQEDVAYEADVSLRHLQKIEAGSTNPRLGTLFSIATVLGTTAHELLEEAASTASTPASRKRRAQP